MRVSSLLVCLLLPFYLQGQILFEKTFGSDACTEEAQSLAIRNDTSLFLSGQQVCGAGPRIPLLYALDQDGDTITTNTNPPFNGSILKHKMNVYTFLGDKTYPANNDSIHLFSVKPDSGVRWQRSYFWGICNNAATAQVAGFNSSTLLTGIYSFSNCTNPVYNSFYALTDKKGNVLWTSFIKGSQNDQIHAAKETPDKRFALAGWTDSKGAGLADFLLVKINTAGDTMWSETYGNALANKCYGLAIAPDSGFYMIGYDDSTRIIKTDQQGKKEWTKVLGKSCGGSDFSINKSIDGSYTAFTLEKINGTCRSVLYKLRPNGSVLWRKVFKTGRLKTYQERPDTSYVLAGYVYDTATFQSDFLVTGFDSTTFAKQTSTLPSVSTPSKSELVVYPNPVSTTATVQVEAKTKMISNLTIYSYDGKQIRQINRQRQQIRITKGDLPTGIYLVRAQTTEGERLWGKIVFQ